MSANWMDVEVDNCSVQRTLDVIGEKWTLLLIREAANGVHRFDEFARHIGLSEGVLADRLRTLVNSGIFDTVRYRSAGQRTRHEYRLTAKGWDLFPVLIALMQWGDDHLANADGPAWQVRHRTCGALVRAEVRCTHDGESVTHREAEAGPGPGAHLTKEEAFL